jgi:putative OPT family oligopeptide transporter
VPDHAISKILIFWLSMLGGSLGILILIPLRKYLVEKEHGQLKFPEGTACARIIIVGDKGGSFGRTAVLGLGLGASYKALMSLGRLWSEFPQHNFTGFLNGGTIGVHAAPSLMGVGYIIGARTSALMLSGAVIGYLALAPLLAFIGEQIPGFIIGPGTIPLNEMDAAALRDSYIKYLGIGAIAFGGAVALLKCLPGTIRSFTAGIMPMIRRGIPGRQSLPRTDRDLSMATVLFGVLIIIIATLFLPGSGLPFVGALIAVLFGFFSCSYPPGSSV